MQVPVLVLARPFWEQLCSRESISGVPYRLENEGSARVRRGLTGWMGRRCG